MQLTRLKEWRKLTSRQWLAALEGWRMRIRTWPQENGWEDNEQMRTGHALTARRGGAVEGESRDNYGIIMG
jgi:hypothetical protein